MVLGALCLAIASLPFTRHYGSVPFYLLLALAVGLGFWKGEGRKIKWNEFSTPLAIPILIFTGIGLTSILSGFLYGGDYLLVAFVQFLKTWLTPFFLFYWVYHTVREKKEIRVLALTLIAVTTVIALKASVDYFFERDRVGGVMEDPNVLAAFLNAYLFLPLGFFLAQPRKPVQWLLLLPFLIDTRGVMVALSRGGFLAFGLGLHAIVFFRNKLVFLALVIGTAVILLNPVFLPAGVRYRMAETFEKPLPASITEDSVKGMIDQSSRHRIEIWEGALKLIAENPVLGVGYHLFESRIEHYWPESVALDPHNTYLFIAGELGIPAAMIFLGMYLIAIGGAQELYRLTRDPLSKALSLGFLGGIFALLSSHLYTTELDAPEVLGYFWVLAAMIFRLRKLESAHV